MYIHKNVIKSIEKIHRFYLTYNCLGNNLYYTISCQIYCTIYLCIKFIVQILVQSLYNALRKFLNDSKVFIKV